MSWSLARNLPATPGVQRRLRILQPGCPKQLGGVDIDQQLVGPRPVDPTLILLLFLIFRSNSHGLQPSVMRRRSI